MRGGLTLNGAANPAPRRNFPWGITLGGDEANLKRAPLRGPQPVGSFPADTSPYGVVDLAGNVNEWIGSAPTGDPDPARFFRETTRLVRGGDWSDTEPDDLVGFTPIENERPGDTRSYAIGFRCVTPPAP